MLKKILVAIIVLGCVEAVTQILLVSAVVHKNNTITNFSVSIQEGSPSILLEGDYRIDFVDAEKNIVGSARFDVPFLIFTEPPQLLDRSEILLKIPFTRIPSSVNIYYKESLIFSQNVSLCDSDGQCDAWESYLSCAGDCPSGSSDGYCDKVMDGKCDPDCSALLDKDCEEKVIIESVAEVSPPPIGEAPAPPSGIDTGTALLIVGSAVVLVLLVFLFLRLRRRKISS